MIRFLFGLLLAASLLFNAFVVAGYLLASPFELSTSGNGTVVQKVATDLDLSNQQKSAFADLRSKAREEFAALAAEADALQIQLAEVLKEDDPDAQVIESLMQEHAEVRHEMRAAGSRRFSQFIQSLSPEQRQRIAERMKRLRRLHDPHRRHGSDDHASPDRRRGSHDGGPAFGDRSPDRESQRLHRERRRADFEKIMKRKLIEKFDSDMDGALSLEEWEAMRGWITGPGPAAVPS